MKRNYLLLALLATALIFSACKKDETTDPVASKKAEYTKALTAHKWILTAATSSPAYELDNGSYATNLMKDGYLDEFELDDYISFNENGTQTIFPGTLHGADHGYNAEKGATWNFKFNDDASECTLNFQIPFFYDWDNDPFTYDAPLENATVLSLTNSELRVKYTFNDDAGTAKKTYSFVLTYSKK